MKISAPVNKLLLVILLCCLGAAVYSNTFNSPFHFDDEHAIVKNLNIKNLSDLKLIWNYWPTRFLATLSLAFNYYLHGLDLFGYHLFNLAIHLCAAILAWWFILLTLATPAMKNDKITGHANLIAFFAAAVFVAHPVQTQAVTYIIQRSTVLAAIFYLLSLCLYIKSRIVQIEEKPGSNLYYTASLITALAGIYTKEFIITLPIAIILYEFFFLKERGHLNWKKAFPFLIISLIIPITVIFRISEHHPDIPARYYLLTQFRVILTYLRLLFIPVNQNLDYDYPIIKTLLEPAALAGILSIAFILIMAIRSFRRYRLLSFSVFWFFLVLLPESSIFPLHDVIFEHRLYLATLGYSIFLVSAVYYLFKKKQILTMIVVLLLTVNWYALLAYGRNLDWRDEFTLWDDTAGKSPNKARPYNNRGLANISLGNLDQGISDFDKAINIDPDYRDPYYNLSNAYYAKGDFNKSVFYLNRAIQLHLKDFKADLNQSPSISYSYRTFADSYNAVNKNNKTISAGPGLAELYIYAAVFYGNIGKHGEAVDLCRKAIGIKPDSSDAYFNLGAAYGNMGEFKEAINSFRKAIAINPKSAPAHNALSAAYYNMKDYSLAIRHADKALELGYPVYPEFLKSLKK
ncbi:MAG: tetratricopeptide repeat protein [Candidatus Omnitrophota bacterium]